MEIISVGPRYQIKVRSDKERQILDDFTCMGNLKKPALRDPEQIGVCEGWGVGRGQNG